MPEVDEVNVLTTFPLASFITNVAPEIVFPVDLSIFLTVTAGILILTFGLVAVTLIVSETFFVTGYKRVTGCTEPLVGTYL